MPDNEAKNRHNARFEKRKPSYMKHIGDIERKIDLANAGDLSLTPYQRDKLLWNLAVLQHRLENGHATRWDLLPESLYYSNPQGSQRGRFRDRDFT